MYWINGQQQRYIDASDRAIQFGDGCFTTIAIKNTKPLLLSAHIQRLQQGCSALYLPEPDWISLKNHLIDIAALTQDNSVIKVIISRGSGGRGYSPKGLTKATVITSLASYPDHYEKQQNNGICLEISPILLGQNAQLAGIKHLNRLEQVLIKYHLETTNADDVLVCNHDGYLVEANAANIFWRKGNDIFTPDLSLSGVNGIMRQVVIQFALKMQWGMNIVNVTTETLYDADEIWLTNTLMPVIPVNCIHFSENKHFEYPNRDYYHVVLQHCLSLE